MQTCGLRRASYLAHLAQPLLLVPAREAVLVRAHTPGQDVLRKDNFFREAEWEGKVWNAPNH